MFTFCIENHEFFGSLTNNCPKLDKNKSIVSSFLAFVVRKSAVSIVKKTMYDVSIFVNECLYLQEMSPDISIKSAKLHFQSWKTIFLNDFALFL